MSHGLLQLVLFLALLLLWLIVIEVKRHRNREISTNRRGDSGKEIS
jgi:uncharacterized membrane protein